MNFILKKDHLKSFLRKLQKTSRLVAPVQNRYGDTLFSVVSDVDGADIDLLHQAQGSIKPFLFPQQQTIFKYKNESVEQYSFTEVNADEEPTVFFGLRSCDLSAILYMDVIFLKDNKDPYYLKKRDNTVLISLGCNDPFANCFCLAAKSGPFMEFGFDLQLTDLGDSFFVETGRAQGEELVEKWQQFFSPASEEDDKARYQATLEAKGKFKRQVLVDLAIQRLADGIVPEEVWSRLSSLCQDCGGCAYICPTCTCYNITDKKISEQQGERLRTWDACTFKGFSGMAGGHNPIAMDTDRIRRRFLHKLYYDVKQHGRGSCVGCGRCVDMCFGGVDIIKFIEMATAETRGE